MTTLDDITLEALIDRKFQQALDRLVKEKNNGHHDQNGNAPVDKKSSKNNMLSNGTFYHQDFKQSLEAQIRKDQIQIKKEIFEESKKCATLEESVEEDDSMQPDIDTKLLLNPQVCTIKLDHMGLFSQKSFNYVDNRHLIDLINFKSNPVKNNNDHLFSSPKNVVNIEISDNEDHKVEKYDNAMEVNFDVKREDGGFETKNIAASDENVKNYGNIVDDINIGGDESFGDIFEENNVVDEVNTSNTCDLEITEDSITKEEQRVELNSNLFKKPVTCKYDRLNLIHNPDFNISLKGLSTGFFTTYRNVMMLQQCIPLTIDVSKAFESKLVNSTVYLKGNNREQFIHDLDIKIKENVSEILSSACASSFNNLDRSDTPSLVDSGIPESPVSCERNTLINLPSKTDVRRINQTLLTAAVPPIKILPKTYVEPVVSTCNKLMFTRTPKPNILNTQRPTCRPIFIPKLISQKNILRLVPKKILNFSLPGSTTAPVKVTKSINISNLPNILNHKLLSATGSTRAPVKVTKSINISNPPSILNHKLISTTGATKFDKPTPHTSAVTSNLHENQHRKELSRVANMLNLHNPETNNKDKDIEFNKKAPCTCINEPIINNGYMIVKNNPECPVHRSVDQSDSCTTISEEQIINNLPSAQCTTGKMSSNTNVLRTLLLLPDAVRTSAVIPTEQKNSFLVPSDSVTQITQINSTVSASNSNKSRILNYAYEKAEFMKLCLSDTHSQNLQKDIQVTSLSETSSAGISEKTNCVIGNSVPHQSNVNNHVFNQLDVETNIQNQVQTYEPVKNLNLAVTENYSNLNTNHMEPAMPNLMAISQLPATTTNNIVLTSMPKLVPISRIPVTDQEKPNQMEKAFYVAPRIQNKSSNTPHLIKLLNNPLPDQEKPNQMEKAFYVAPRIPNKSSNAPHLIKLLNNPQRIPPVICQQVGIQNIGVQNIVTNNNARQPQHKNQRNQSRQIINNQDNMSELIKKDKNITIVTKSQTTQPVIVHSGSMSNRKRIAPQKAKIIIENTEADKVIDAEGIIIDGNVEFVDNGMNIQIEYIDEMVKLKQDSEPKKKKLDSESAQQTHEKKRTPRSILKLSEETSSQADDGSSSSWVLFGL